MKNLILFSSVLFFFINIAFAQGWQSVANFGSNPGNLKAYSYVPSNVPPSAPLVVVMHGCTQNATGFSNQTAWNTLADKHKFYVIHAEQQSANNSSSCFNYWEPGDHSRGQGEARSIKQMVDYMKSNYSIDSARVYATGLSAGGAMTAVMLCTYPDVFEAGAEMAGLPYKVAESSLQVSLAAIGQVSKSPQQWGDLVRAQFPGFTGRYPRLAVFHGTSDIIINDNNATEIVKQFTNLHNTDQNADNTVASFNGNSRVELRQYENAAGEVVLERYTISNMAHGIAVGPGPCKEQGGVAGSNSIDVDFYSSYWAAKFFGILRAPYDISGDAQVTANESGITYNVPATTGSTFDWQTPAGVTITSGAGTNAITVNWGDSSGTLTVTETASNGCVNDAVSLFVTAIPTNDTTDTWVAALVGGEKITIAQTGTRAQVSIETGRREQFQLALFNAGGQLIFTTQTETGTITELPVMLQPGFYIVHFMNEKKYFTRKLVMP